MKRSDRNIKNFPTLVAACTTFVNYKVMSVKKIRCCVTHRIQLQAAAVSAPVSTSSSTRIREALCDFFESN